MDAGRSRAVQCNAYMRVPLESGVYHEIEERPTEEDTAGCTLVLALHSTHRTQTRSLAPTACVPVAIEYYSKCLSSLQRQGKSMSDLAMKAHSNRAACYKQISNFDGVIEDCTAVLEVDPENVKALVRRAQAFEGVERYRFALQDIKMVLAMPGAKVGKSNYDMCNMMQHRLNRTVQQLKAGNC